MPKTLLNRRASSSKEIYASGSENPSAAVPYLQSSTGVENGYAHPLTVQENQPVDPPFQSIFQTSTIDQLKAKSPPPSRKHSTISGIIDPPKLTNRPSPTLPNPPLPNPPFLIDASYRPPPLFGHSHSSTTLSQSLPSILTASAVPSTGPAPPDLEPSTGRVKSGEVDSTVSRPSISAAQVTHTHDSVAVQSLSPKLDILPPPATSAVVNPIQPPSEPVAEEISNLDEVYLFELSETPIISTPLPTVFDFNYYNPRYRDLWAIGQDGQPDPILMQRMRSQMAIAEIRTDIQTSYGEGVDDDDEEEEEEEFNIENIGPENHLSANMSSAIQIQETPGKQPPQTQDKLSSQIPFRPDNSAATKSAGYPTMDIKSVDSHEAEDSPMDLPEELAVRIDQWSFVLKSFIKGKKRFQPQVRGICTFVFLEFP